MQWICCKSAKLNIEHANNTGSDIKAFLVILGSYYDNFELPNYVV